MLLAIDIGNTNTVFALFKGDAVLQSWRLCTENARTADEYAAFLGHMCALAGIKLAKIKEVMISSVVPETNFHVENFCRHYLQADPVFITKDNVPIEIDLKRPEDVGADRLVNALAIKRFYQTPAIVIDFGTATTFDVVDAQGRYAGGVIAPGIDLSVNALHQAASKLPKVSVEKPDHVIGKSTVEAMQSGIYWGYAGLIEGVVAKIRQENGHGPMFVLATGGLAPLFAQGSSVIDTVDEHLTLKGLLEIYKNRKSGG